jgi:hypothetical protein
VDKAGAVAWKSTHREERQGKDQQSPCEKLYAFVEFPKAYTQQIAAV